MTTTLERPAAVQTRRGLAGLCVAYFMVLLDMTVLSVAEPDLARSLHAPVGGLQWVVNGYTVAFAALLLPAGALADRLGAHRVFRAGTGLFGLGSLLAAAAPGLGELVALRALLGVAAAGILPAALAMMVKLYPESRERTGALALWAAVSGAGLAAGPVAGGLLVDWAGWRAVFLLNVPLALGALALVAIPAVRVPSGDRPLDLRAQAAIGVVLALLTDAMIAAGDEDFRHAVLSGLAAVLAGSLSVWLERRSAAPALAPHILKAPGLAPGLLAGAALNFALTGALFVLPLVLQQQFALSPTRTGLAFLPLTLPFVVNPILTGRIVVRAGVRGPAVGGLALLTAGGLVLAWAAWQTAPYAVLALGLLATGFGVSFTLPALMAGVLAAAPEGAAGAAGGLFNAARQVGATLGVAVMGAPVAAQGVCTGAALALVVSAAVTALAMPALVRRR